MYRWCRHTRPAGQSVILAKITGVSILLCAGLSIDFLSFFVVRSRTFRWPGPRRARQEDVRRGQRVQPQGRNCRANDYARWCCCNDVAGREPPIFRETFSE